MEWVLPERQPWDRVPRYVGIAWLVNSDTGDWTLLFGQWGLLDYDLRIGQFVRMMGWLGMLAAMGWLVYRMYRDSQPEPRPLELSQ